MRNRLLLFLASALLCSLPVLALHFPSLLSSFANDAGSQQNWRSGLWVGLGTLSFLAWRLNQTRLVAAALALTASAQWFWSAHMSAAPLSPAGITAEEAWLVALPLGLGLMLLPREGALFSQRTLVRLLLLALPALILWSAFNVDPTVMNQGMDWRAWGAPGTPDPAHVAHLSLLIFGAILRFRRDPKWLDAQAALAGGLLGQVALAWGLAYTPGPADIGARVWLASHFLLLLCLLTAVFLMYWQRVYLDELTGIPNRRALDEALSHLDGPYCLAMADIDHFKKFNDSYGHDQGDDVLKLVGSHLYAGTQGRAYRYGGEEFCVLLPGMDPDMAEAMIEGVRASLAKRRFAIRLPQKIRKKTSEEDRGTLKAKTQDVQVTLSLGLAIADKRYATPAQVMKLADEGLYAAKEAGRNNVQRMN